MEEKDNKFSNVYLNVLDNWKYNTLIHTAIWIPFYFHIRKDSGSILIYNLDILNEKDLSIWLVYIPIIIGFIRLFIIFVNSDSHKDKKITVSHLRATITSTLWLGTWYNAYGYGGCLLLDLYMVIGTLMIYNLPLYLGL